MSSASRQSPFPFTVPNALKSPGSPVTKSLANPIGLSWGMGGGVSHGQDRPVTSGRGCVGAWLRCTHAGRVQRARLLKWKSGRIRPTPSVSPSFPSHLLCSFITFTPSLCYLYVFNQA